MQSNNINLASLKNGECAKVKELKIHGDMRRRLSDLGFISGADVSAVYSDLNRHITAYSICGTVIALRRSDAENIIVNKR